MSRWNPQTASERLFAQVNKTGPVPQHLPELGPCWLWTAYVNRKGYGRLRGDDGKKVLVHRLSWSLAFGVIPTGLDVLHHCDTAACVNPAHCYLGTDADNALDRVKRMRSPTKLVAEDVVAIRRALAAGDMLQRDIAHFFDVSPAVITEIKMGRRWRHVEVSP